MPAGAGRLFGETRRASCLVVVLFLFLPLRRPAHHVQVLHRSKAQGAVDHARPETVDLRCPLRSAPHAMCWLHPPQPPPQLQTPPHAAQHLQRLKLGSESEVTPGVRPLVPVLEPALGLGLGRVRQHALPKSGTVCLCPLVASHLAQCLSPEAKLAADHRTNEMTPCTQSPR